MVGIAPQEERALAAAQEAGSGPTEESEQEVVELDEVDSDGEGELDEPELDGAPKVVEKKNGSEPEAVSLKRAQRPEEDIPNAEQVVMERDIPNATKMAEPAPIADTQVQFEADSQVPFEPDSQVPVEDDPIAPANTTPVKELGKREGSQAVTPTEPEQTPANHRCDNKRLTFEKGTCTEEGLPFEDWCQGCKAASGRQFRSPAISIGDSPVERQATPLKASPTALIQERQRLEGQIKELQGKLSTAKKMRQSQNLGFRHVPKGLRKNVHLTQACCVMLDASVVSNPYFSYIRFHPIHQESWRISRPTAE